jgi:hypothetical protein
MKRECKLGVLDCYNLPAILVLSYVFTPYVSVKALATT